jgi:hypothetical protein
VEINKLDLEDGVCGDNIAGPGVDNIVVGSGTGKLNNMIIMVEEGGQPDSQEVSHDGGITEIYTHIPEVVLQHIHLQTAGVSNIPPVTYHHQQVVRDGPQDGDVQREEGCGEADAEENDDILVETV